MRNRLQLDVTHAPAALVPHGLYVGTWGIFCVYFCVGLGLMLTRVSPPFGALSDFLFILFAACVVFLNEARQLGWGKTVLAFSWVALFSGVMETIGTLSGFPFGNYTYTEAFGPRFAGVLPLAIPLAWWLILMPVYRLLEGLRKPAPILFVGLVALGVSAIDLVIEPVAVVIKSYWIWHDGGFYYGVPWTNFAGWIATAAILTLGLNRIVKRPDSATPSPPTTYRQHAYLLILVLLFFMVVLLRDGIIAPAVLALLLIATAWLRK